MSDLIADREAQLQDTRLRIDNLRILEKDNFTRQSERHQQIDLLVRQSNTRSHPEQLNLFRTDLKEIMGTTAEITEDLRDLSLLLVKLVALKRDQHEKDIPASCDKCLE